MSVVTREQELRKVDERYRFAVGGSGDGVWDWDVVTGKIFFSDQLKRQLGYERHEITDHISEWDKRLHIEDKERVYEKLNNHLRGHASLYQSEYRLRCKNGAYKWILSSGMVVERNECGEALRAVGMHKDIDKRKKNENELSLAQFVLEKSPVAVLRFSADGSIVYVNSLGCTIFGRAQEDIIGRKIWNFDREMSEKRWYQYWEKIKVGIISIHEMTIPRPGGQVGYYELSANYLEFEDKEYLIGYGRDITEQKQIAEVVKHQQDSMATLLDSLPGIAFLKDSQLRYIMCNNTFCQAVGYSNEELKGKTDEDLFLPEIAKKYRNADELVMASCVMQEFEEDTLVQGEITQVLTRKVPIHDAEGQGIGLVGLGFDITAMKNLERSLAHESDIKHAMISALTLGIHVYRVDTGACVLVNQAAGNIVNATTEQLYQQNFYHIKSWQKYGLLTVALAALAEGMEQTIEEQIITSFNRQVWLKCRFIPFASGGEAHLLLLTEDISQRKQMEDLAASAMQTKTEFLASMSHEIRTPVSSILSMSQLLLDMQITEEQESCIQMICKSSESLLGIINDILDFSKIEADKMTVEQVAFNLPKLLNEIVEVMDIKATEKKLDLKLVTVDNIPEVINSDSLRLRQVLINLISNAIKFTQQGTVLIQVRATEQEGNLVLLRFEVADTVIGIESDKQEKLFSTFTQVDASTTRRFGGSGLGLAISKRLVEMMGGAIGMESTFGQGSIFWFTIVVHKMDTLIPENNNIPMWKKIGTKEIMEKIKPVLIAEDTVILQIIIKMQLQKLGVACHVVSDGLEVVTEGMTNQYSMILMDCHMPNMDGYEATKLIREQEQGSDRHIPIIALTADAMSGTKEKCLQSGMDDYLSKPIDIKLFIGVLQKWLFLNAQDVVYDKLEEVGPVIDTPIIDIKKIADLKTMVDDDMEIVREIVQDYLENGWLQILDLQQAVVVGNLTEIKEIAHRMRAPSSYLGAEQLSKIFGIIEEYARGQDWESISCSVENINEEMEKVSLALKKIIE